MTAFTKEQLITRARENLRDLRRVAITMTGHDAVVVAMQIQVEEIALAALTSARYPSDTDSCGESLIEILIPSELVGK